MTSLSPWTSMRVLHNLTFGHQMTAAETLPDPEGALIQCGGNLIQKRWICDDQNMHGRYIDFDVMDRIPAYLYEKITLAKSLTLRDIFALVEKSPFLKEYLHHYWIDEFLSEAKSVTKASVEINAKSIEYLELYWSWEYDQESQAYKSPLRPDFHGVGILQQEDIIEHNHVVCPKGQGINWSISTADLGEIIDLPLKIRDEALIAEDAPPLKILSDTTLGQMLEGIFWELSFYGGPEGRRSFNEDLAKAAKEEPLISWDPDSEKI
jgi:hypothetical protein